MDKADAIKKLNQLGFKAKDEQNMVYVDLTKVDDENIVDTIFKLQDTLKEMGYNKSFGFKYNSSALDIVVDAMKKAKDAQPPKEIKEEEPVKKTRIRSKKSGEQKSEPKKEIKETEKINEEKPKRTRKSSKQEPVVDVQEDKHVRTKRGSKKVIEDVVTEKAPTSKKTTRKKKGE